MEDYKVRLDANEQEARRRDEKPVVQQWAKVDYVFVHVQSHEVPTRFKKPWLLWEVRHSGDGDTKPSQEVFTYGIPSGSRDLAVFVRGLQLGDKVAVRYLGKDEAGWHKFVWMRF